jgi:hypothetical protein
MHRADASAHRGPLRSRGYPSRKNPPRGRRRAAWPPTRAQPHFAPRGGLPWPAAPGWVASAQGRPQPVPPAHQATMGRRGQSCSSPLAPPHELISPLTCAYLVRELKGLAVVERCSFARTLRRFTTGSPSSAYRLLSDPLSDYGVDGPYIQLDIHGLSSRSVPDLDDSPTVLRDEEIAGCHPDHKTPGQRRIQIPDWSTRLQVQPPSLPAWSACRMHIKINQKSCSGSGRV